MKRVCRLSVMVIVTVVCSVFSDAQDYPESPIFDVRMDYYASEFSYEGQFADMDNDGDRDYVYASYNLNNVIVHICKNAGDGSYGSQFTIIRSGESPEVYCADLDGDNDYDIALTIEDRDSLYIYENTSSGGSLSFTLIGEYIALTRPECIFGADLDDDSDVDIVVGNSGSGDFTVFLNDGSATFGAQSYGSGLNPYDIWATDFDGDNVNDVAVANLAAGYISVFLNNGDGTFGSGTNYTTDYSDVIACADYDGDTDNDIVVEDPYGVSILYNNGDGSFAAAVDYAAEPNTRYVYSVDLDGDSDHDIISSHTLDRISVLINLGGGVFAPAAYYGVGHRPFGIAAADVDGDSDVDLAVHNMESGNFSILRNTGDGTFIIATEYETGGRPTCVVAEDFNADGYKDLAVPSYSDSSVSILFNTGGGQFAPRVVYHVGRSPRAVCAVDLDGDSDYDLAIAKGIDTASVLLNNGDGTFGPVTFYPTFSLGYDIVAADFDGDDDIDLGISNSKISILFNYGNGTFSPPINYDAGGNTPRGICAADLDNDNDIDLASANQSTSFSVLLNIGNGSFLPEVRYYLDGNERPIDIAAADFDFDDDLDLLVACTTDNYIELFLNNGDGTFEPWEFLIAAAGKDPTSFAIGHINDDGYPDFIHTNQHGNSVYVVFSGLIDGEIEFYESSGWYKYGVGVEPLSVFLADLDNDGDNDAITANYEHDNISVLFNLLAGGSDCDCNPGDANNDGSANVGDAVYLISYVFKSGPAPQPYALCSGDANKDCGSNVGDAVYLINYVFKEGPPPASCEEWLVECGGPLR